MHGLKGVIPVSTYNHCMIGQSYANSEALLAHVRAIISDKTLTATEARRKEQGDPMDIGEVSAPAVEAAVAAGARRVAAGGGWAAGGRGIAPD